ncbi:transposase [Jannaschia helgolandensis]
MNGPAFDTDIETQPVPELEPGTVVILDNLSTHKGPPAAEAMKRHVCWHLFLPPYSPDPRCLVPEIGVPEAQIPLATDRGQNFQRSV